MKEYILPGGIALTLFIVFSCSALIESKAIDRQPMGITMKPILQPKGVRHAKKHRWALCALTYKHGQGPDGSPLTLKYPTVGALVDAKRALRIPYRRPQLFLRLSAATGILMEESPSQRRTGRDTAAFWVPASQCRVLGVW